MMLVRHLTLFAHEVEHHFRCERCERRPQVTLQAFDSVEQMGRQIVLVAECHGERREKTFTWKFDEVTSPGWVDVMQRDVLAWAKANPFEDERWWIRWAAAEIYHAWAGDEAAAPAFL